MNLSFVRLLIFDFDGVFTDNLVYTDSSGNELISCSKTDSLAISNFKKKFPNVPIIVLSSELNSCVSRRCSKLGLDLIQCSGSKEQYLASLISQYKVQASECMYIGNDVNDLPAKSLGIGFICCPLDSSPIFSAVCNYIIPRPGGNGAIAYMLELLSHSLDARSPRYYQPVFLDTPLSNGHREWGSEDIITVSQGNYSFKKLFIRKGCSGGLQYHRWKDETAYLVSGLLKIYYIDKSSEITCILINPGSCVRFRPGCIHKEEALEDCLLLEVSTPHASDRVRCEHLYDVSLPSQGLPSTLQSDLQFLGEYPPLDA